MSESLRPDGQFIPRWHLLDTRTRRLFAGLALAWSVKIAIDLVQRLWIVAAADLLLAAGFGVGP